MRQERLCLTPFTAGAPAWFQVWRLQVLLRQAKHQARVHDHGGGPQSAGTPALGRLAGPLQRIQLGNCSGWLRITH